MERRARERTVGRPEIHAWKLQHKLFQGAKLLRARERTEGKSASRFRLHSWCKWREAAALGVPCEHESELGGHQQQQQQQLLHGFS